MKWLSLVVHLKPASFDCVHFALQNPFFSNIPTAFSILTNPTIFNAHTQILPRLNYFVVFLYFPAVYLFLPYTPSLPIVPNTFQSRYLEIRQFPYHKSHISFFSLFSTFPLWYIILILISIVILQISGFFRLFNFRVNREICLLCSLIFTHFLHYFVIYVNIPKSYVI